MLPALRRDHDISPPPLGEVAQRAGGGSAADAEWPPPSLRDTSPRGEETESTGVQGALSPVNSESNPAKSIACRFYTVPNHPRSPPPHNQTRPHRGGGRTDPARCGGGDRLSGAAFGARARSGARRLLRER